MTITAALNLLSPAGRQRRRTVRGLKALLPEIEQSINDTQHLRAALEEKMPSPAFVRTDAGRAMGTLYAETVAAIGELEDMQQEILDVH